MSKKASQIGLRNSFPLGGSLLLHGALAIWFALLPKDPPKQRVVVEVDIRKPRPPQPALTPPEPEKPPEPERKIVEKKPERPVEAPRTTKPAKEPPKQVVPVFGLSEKDTTSDSSMAVPLGNTTMADPQKRPKGDVPPLPPSTGTPGKEYNPVSEVNLKKMPDHDTVACGNSMKEKYNTSPAYAEGVEGEVVLRIELDEQGKIRNVKKVKGLGHGLDEMAIGFLRFNPRCRFSPAIAKDGKPAAFVIERYTVTFEIPR